MASRQLEYIEDIVKAYDVNIVKILIKGDPVFNNENDWCTCSKK
jgi:hypothetical protein